MKYENLTPEEKKFLCNGAGKKGIQGWLVPEFVFTEAANRHDYDYWRGCTEEDRMKADRLFLSNMLDAAERKDNGKRRFWFFRFFYRKMALRYYEAVREAGANPTLGGFYFAEKKRTRVDLLREMKENCNTV